MKGQPDFSHITTVIFDMDGTLIQHTWQLSKVCEVLFGRFAGALAPISQDEFFDCYWPKSEDMWYMMVDGVINGDVAAKYGYVNTLRALGRDTTLAEPLLAYWTELVLEEARPFSDTFQVLDAISQDYTTGILTNGFIRLQRKKIEKYNFADHVDFTLVSEEAGFHKPDKQVFIEMLKLAGNVSAEETLYIGDNLQADIVGALGAGIMPILMNADDDVQAPDGVIKINRLTELLSLLAIPS